jgi:small-conductance mechanosensitive channel
VVVVIYDHRVQLFGTRVAARPGHPAHHHLEQALDTPITVITVLLLVTLGWAIARDIGRGLGPPLFRRLDPATAGTVGFLIRLATIVLTLIVALRVAGIEARTLALGGAFTAVVFGLAAQQTLGNLIAGTVLLSARPFRVGDMVRLQGGPIGGELEGTVSSLGLLYTTLAKGENTILVPNSSVLNAAILPLREPQAVNLRARVRADMAPGDLQELLERAIKTQLRDVPRITLEEIDGDEVIVQIAATPRLSAEGRNLASELLDVVSQEVRSDAEAHTP